MSGFWRNLQHGIKNGKKDARIGGENWLRPKQMDKIILQKWLQGKLNDHLRTHAANEQHRIEILKYRILYEQPPKIGEQPKIVR